MAADSGDPAARDFGICDDLALVAEVKRKQDAVRNIGRVSLDFLFGNGFWIWSLIWSA